jgi:hypothetical protein
LPACPLDTVRVDDGTACGKPIVDVLLFSKFHFFDGKTPSGNVDVLEGF